LHYNIKNYFGALYKKLKKKKEKKKKILIVNNRKIFRLFTNNPDTSISINPDTSIRKKGEAS
jgi:hypothetical protein